MYALIFAAIALALIFTPPRFRKVAFGVVGALFLIFLAIVFVNRRPVPEVPPIAGDPKRDAPVQSNRFNFDKYEQEKRDQEDPEARTRIPASEVRFDQIQALAGVESGTIQSIHARLYNDSHQFTLTDYSSYLVIQDCLPAAASEISADQCTTVYDQRDSASLTVPPDQARDIVILIPKNPTNFSAPFKLLGTPRIELTAMETRAYQVKGSTP